MPFMGLQLPVVVTNPQSNNVSFTIVESYDLSKFRLIHLKNNMKVLLTTELVQGPYQGASMTVNTGFFDDPDSHLGLAHLCEHVLTQSSEKYPELNKLRKFIKAPYHAVTESLQTTYFFMTTSSNFFEALDIFAQYFVSPLFRRDYLWQELNAVHDEYVISLSSYEDRVIQLAKHISNPGHPFHRFYRGNMDTLNKQDLREQLVRFYQENYSANLVSSLFSAVII